MYLEEDRAIAVRDYWQVPLKALAPSITRMSVRPHGSGGGYYLELGLLRTPPPTDEQTNLDTVLRHVAGETVLPAPPPPSPQHGPLTVDFVTTGAMRLIAGGTWTGDVEPVRGGHKVARINDPYPG